MAKPRGRRIEIAALYVVLGALVILPITGILGANQVTAQAFTPYPNGQSCVSPSECASGFCAQSVCCNRSCDGAFESCTDPGSVGTCTTHQPAPALSWQLQLVTVGLLMLLAWRRLTRRSNGGA